MICYRLNNNLIMLYCSSYHVELRCLNNNVIELTTICVYTLLCVQYSIHFNKRFAQGLKTGIATRHSHINVKTEMHKMARMTFADYTRIKTKVYQVTFVKHITAANSQIQNHCHLLRRQKNNVRYDSNVPTSSPCRVSAALEYENAAVAVVMQHCCCYLLAAVLGCCFH